jgi:hypothetical protein
MLKFTVEDRLERNLKRSGSNVFIRKDSEQLGGYDQVGRALRSDADDGHRLASQARLARLHMHAVARFDPTSHFSFREAGVAPESSQNREYRSRSIANGTSL